VPLLEDGQLLARGEVLHHQFQPGPEQDPGKSTRQYPSEVNRGVSIAGGWPMGKANAAPEVTEGPRNQSLRNNVEGQGSCYAFRMSSQPLRYTGRLMKGAASGAFVARRLT